MDEARADPKQQSLAKVLLDFGRAPGKYPVRLGEPRELHAELDTLTVWALGRLPEALEPQATPLREAAVLFIARSCFAPEATHYQMFGLTPKACTPEALRIRYRNLIRLTHPDMGIKGLPPNAAGAVNRAQGVLSDPELRRRYDEELAERRPGAKAAERELLARSDAMRRIEHRVTPAERWQSMKARFPNLARIGAVAAGVTVVSAGVLLLALTGQNDERSLIEARSPYTDVHAAFDRGTIGDEQPRPTPPEPEVRGAVQTAHAAASAATAPPASDRAARTPGPVADQASPVASAPPARVADPIPMAPPAISPPPAPAPAATRVLAQGNAERQAEDIVRDPSARLKAEPSVAATAGAGKVSLLQPSGRPAPPPVSVSAAEAQAAAMPPAEPRRSAPPQQEPAAETEDAASIRGNAAPVRVATAPAIPAPLPATSTTAKPDAPSGAGGQVWNVDTTGAKHYLSELISVLERPDAANRANAYLTEMKVKGSLFRPVLRVMRDFSEIDVARVEWSDSLAPGVLKVRGTLVLQAKGSQAPFLRTANFRLTAEFWGTPNGTVLAELDLRETE